jgi:hypothetical protein
MLLALKDEQGTFASGAWIRIALGGAVLAELLLEKRIGTQVEGKKKFARILDPRPTGDVLLDEGLTKIRQAKRRATLETWVSRFSGIKKLRERTAERLCQRGVLRADEDKVLLLFTRKIYPEVDPGPEREILARLESAIFTSTSEIDPRTVVLIALADSTGILKTNMDKKKLKKRKQRIEQITSGSLMHGATKEAVEAAQAAVMLTAVMPALYGAAT